MQKNKNANYLFKYFLFIDKSVNWRCL